MSLLLIIRHANRQAQPALKQWCQLCSVGAYTKYVPCIVHAIMVPGMQVPAEQQPLWHTTCRVECYCIEGVSGRCLLGLCQLKFCARSSRPHPGHHTSAHVCMSYLQQVEIKHLHAHVAHRNRQQLCQAGILILISGLCRWLSANMITGTLPASWSRLVLNMAIL
jgi:hypothetical protein